MSRIPYNAPSCTQSLRPLTAPTTTTSSSFASLVSPLQGQRQAQQPRQSQLPGKQPLHLTLFNGLTRPVPGVLKANFSQSAWDSGHSQSFFPPSTSNCGLRIPSKRHVWRSSCFAAGGLDKSDGGGEAWWRRLRAFALSDSPPSPGTKVR
jgi:hypothetical protein